jgi:hypothetical protein
MVGTGHSTTAGSAGRIPAGSAVEDREDAEGAEEKTAMIDATCLQTHRSASSMFQ